MTELPTQLTIPRDRTALPAAVASRLPNAEITGLIVAFGVWLMIVLLAQPIGRPWGTGMEAISYWANHLHAPYLHSDWTKPGAYVYSPAFLQLLSPLAALPWGVFMGVWTAIMLLAVRFLTGPRLFALGALLAIVELSGGNISLLLAAAMVIGFRYPAALGVRDPDQGHARYRPVVVRRPWRVAPAVDRPRSDGRDHRRLLRDHAGRLGRVDPGPHPDRGS